MPHLRQLFKIWDLDPEKRLLIFALFAMAVASLAMGLNHLFKKTNSKNRDANSTAVLGVIYPDGADIKRKAYRTFEFSKINTQENLFQKDTIYIGPGSKAVLDLRQYGTLKLSPNAVVLITLDFEDEPKNNETHKSDVAHAKRKTLRMKLEEGQAEFIRAPQANKVTPIATGVSEDKIVLEIGSKVAVDLSNQKTFKAENTKDNVARVIAATNPDDVRATTKTKTGDEEKIKLNLSQALMVTPEGIEKVEAEPKKLGLLSEKIETPLTTTLHKVPVMAAHVVRKPAQVVTPVTLAAETPALSPNPSPINGSELKNSLAPNTDAATEDFKISTQLGYGSALVSFQQTGDFGGAKASSLTDVILFNAEAKFLSQVKAGIDYSKYKIKVSTDLSNASSTMSESTQELSLYGGYRIFTLGLLARQFPILKLTGGSGIEWSKLTTVSAAMGANFERVYLSSSLRPYKMGFAFGVELPFTGQGAGALNVKRVSGFGAQAHARVAKGLLGQTKDDPSAYELYIGLEAASAFHHFAYVTISCAGALDSSSTNTQEYLGLFFLEFGI